MDGLFSAIKEKHRDDNPETFRGKPRVEVLDEGKRIFSTSNGLAGLVASINSGGGLLYVVTADVAHPEALKLAIDTGLPFATVSQNNLGWTTNIYNPIVRTTKVANKNTTGATMRR